MSINLLGFKAITSATAAGATIIGGGVTLGIYTGGSSSANAAGGATWWKIQIYQNIHIAYKHF